MERFNTKPVLDPSSWVDAHGDYLYRFSLARVKNVEVAEELVQETLLAALTARHSFRGRSSERSWLTAILKRKIVDWLRQTVRRRATQEALPDFATEAFFTHRGKWKNKPDDWSSDDPGREMSRAEFRQILSECLGKLPTRLRHAFILRHVDERSTDEVCKAIGSSATNLWVMLHRSRLRLWRCLTVNWFREDPDASSEART